jgi:hypothetical protein
MPSGQAQEANGVVTVTKVSNGHSRYTLGLSSSRLVILAVVLIVGGEVLL